MSRERKIGKAVARRARELDALTPGWWERVTVPIDLASDRWCVLGQVYGDAFQSPFVVQLPFARGALLRRGFAYLTLGSRAYATGCWYEEIRARRDSRAPDVIPEWMTERYGAPTHG